MIPVTAFAAGGWWTGLGLASVLITVLAALVVTVVTLVNRIERQAGSILDRLTATGGRTRPLLDRVEADVHLETIVGRTIEETLAEKVAPAARDAAGHLDAVLRS